MRNLLLMLLLTTGMAQAQEGVYVRPVLDGTEVLELSEARCVTRMTRPGTPEVVESASIVGKDHGRLVLGPLEDKPKRFAMLYVVEMTGDWIEVFRDAARYEVPDLAPDHPAPAQLRQGKRFWTVSCYHHLTELPTMPAPSQEEVTQFLDRMRADLHEGVGAHAADEELEDLVIARGYNPFTSKQVFLEARERYQKSDRSFQRKVEEFERWVEGDAVSGR